MTKTQENNTLKRQMLIYIASVSILSITFVILSNQLWFQPISRKILATYAEISSFILNVFGQKTSVEEQSIVSADFSISVRKGCDALAPMILYIFSVVFFKASWKHKLNGLLIGLPILALINIVRICSLFLIGKYGSKQIFDIMHVDIWQIFFIILTLVIWVQWLRRTDKFSNVKV